MSRMNRMHNMSNPAQGAYKRVLCVCSAGLLRSPTASLVLSMPPFNFNTRAAGLSSDYALIIVDDYLVEWADEIVVMTREQEDYLRKLGITKPIVCLGIEDDYSYRDPVLMALIVERYMAETRANAEG